MKSLLILVARGIILKLTGIQYLAVCATLNHATYNYSGGIINHLQCGAFK